jgi:flagellar FliL protein
MKADPKADAAAASNPKKKLFGLIAAAVIALGVGAAAAWYFAASGNASAKEHKQAKVEQPEYVSLDQFTVNLQPGDAGDQYLQVQFTLQVPGLEQAELIKSNMAMVRSRVLLLLSSKHASDINTVDGKHQLAKEIEATLKQPFVAGGPVPQVADVLFTAFIIQ